MDGTLNFYVCLSHAVRVFDNAAENAHWRNTICYQLWRFSDWLVWC